MKNLATLNEEFNISNLSEYQYTLSLIKECVRVKILNKNYIFDVQIKISDILKDLIMKYTNGESSSVTVEKAEKLIITIWYTIDTYIMNFETVKESINALQEEDIKEIYDKGKKLLQKEVENTKRLYEIVMKNKLNTEMTAYNETLDSIKDFFHNYNINYEADECDVSIDYPLSIDDWNRQGVRYIKNYLWNINIENKICSYFDEGEINKLLETYGENYEIDYRDLLINIFELVITNSIFVNINKSPSRKLLIKKDEFNNINNKLKKLNNDEIEQLINNTTNNLLKYLDIKDEFEIDYIEKYKERLVKLTIDTLKRNNLKNFLIVTNKKEDKKLNFTIDNDNKLNDEEFRVVVGNILECEDVFDKIKIIKKHINSIRDFMDILKSNCLFEDEYLELFNSLSNIELAILGKVVFYGEYRMDNLDLMKIINEKINTTYDFEIYYIQCLKEMNKSRLKEIESIINEIK